MSNGETYSFTQGLSYNGKEVLFKVKVTITNEQGSGEGFYWQLPRGKTDYDFKIILVPHQKRPSLARG